MKGYKRWARCAIFAMALTAQPAVAVAQGVVIRSVGPSSKTYPVGHRVGDNDTLNLRPGDIVTLLRPGGTRIFRGPGSMRASAPPVERQFSQRTFRPRTGAVRGGPGIGGAPAPKLLFDSVWQFDASASGRACFRAQAPLVLWRPSFDKPLGLMLTKANSPPVRIDWPAGQQTLALSPAQLSDGGRVAYHVPLATRPTEIALAEVRADPANRDMVAAALLGAGCRDQLDTFIALNEEVRD